MPYRYKPKHKKALWVTAFPMQVKPTLKKKRWKPKTAAQIRQAEYQRKAKVWKVGRWCACANRINAKGEFICEARLHLCEDVHHVRGRGKFLLNDERHWLAVCRRAHRWIHDNPLEATARGWMESRTGSKREPKAIAFICVILIPLLSLSMALNMHQSSQRKRAETGQGRIGA